MNGLMFAILNTNGWVVGALIISHGVLSGLISIGVKKELVIEKFRTLMPARFDTEESDDCVIEGCLFDLDEKTGRCRSAQRIRLN